MGLLDDLKQQAEAVSQAQASSARRALEIAQRTDTVLAHVYAYFADLAKQLAVIKPESQRVFELRGVGSFDKLRLTDFFADYRKKVVEDKEVFDYVLFQYKYLSNRTFEVRKDDALTKEQTEKQLWNAGLKYSMDEFRNERGRTIGAKFTVPGVIVASAHLEGKADSEDLVLTLRNIERFDTMKLQYAAAAIDDSLLEEIAKLIIGRPSQLRNRGTVVL